MRNMGLLVVMLAGCGSSRPAYDDKLVSPAVKGLKVGVATLDDVTKAFPDAKVEKDKSLGGEGVVEFNDHKAIAVHAPGFDSYVVGGKLAHFEMVAPGACDWLIKTMDGMKGSTACPGNRKMGKDRAGNEAAYCASAGDRVVWIECNKGAQESIEYTLGE
jgi:hypothetical protein